MVKCVIGIPFIQCENPFNLFLERGFRAYSITSQVEPAVAFQAQFFASFLTDFLNHGLQVIVDILPVGNPVSAEIVQPF